MAMPGRDGARDRPMRKLDRLYHLANADNVPSILKHGLLSTERLLGLTGMAEAERAAFLRRQRRDNLRLAEGVTIRDQRPMPPSALAQALDDGLEPADWYALLNSYVFLWPDRERMDRQRGACGNRPQIILTFDAVALFDHFGTQAFLSPINCGNARRKPARRGRDTLIPYATWLQEGWPTRQRSHPPAEVLFGCVLPVQAPYLIGIADA
jgi:hypothetical protein